MFFVSYIHTPVELSLYITIRNLAHLNITLVPDSLKLAENLYMMGAPPVDDANYCLRWNDYEKKYAETFRTLRYSFILF